MAEIKVAYVIPWTGHQDQKAAAPGALIAYWLNVSQADTFETIYHPDYSEKTIQIVVNSGTPTLVIEGSCLQAGTPLIQLKNGFNENLSFTAAGLSFILPNVAAIKPRISTGTGNVSVYILMSTIARR